MTSLLPAESSSTGEQLPGVGESTGVSIAPNPRIQYIDGLRGLAVMGVVIFHAGFWGGIAIDSLAMRILSLGAAGVDLFLVLSGFCLFLPLVRQRDGSIRTINFSSYMSRRLWRICPPYFVAIALGIVTSFLAYWEFGAERGMQDFFPFRGADSIFNIFAHVTFVHGFSPRYIGSIDVAFWSLSLEIQFYLTLPLLVAFARRTSLSLMLAIPFAVTLLWRMTWSFVAPGFLKEGVGDALFVSRWIEFAAGIVAAGFVCGMFSKTGFLYRMASRSLYAFVFLLIVTAVVKCVWDRNAALPFLWATTFACLIICGDANESMVRRVLEWKPLVWIGGISYSIYLIHGSVFRILATLFASNAINPHFQTIGFLTAGPILCVAVSYLFHRAFERPFLRYKSRTAMPDVDRHIHGGSDLIGQRH